MSTRNRRPNPRIPQMNTDGVRKNGARQRWSHRGDRISRPAAAHARQSGRGPRNPRQSAISADQGAGNCLETRKSFPGGSTALQGMSIRRESSERSVVAEHRQDPATPRPEDTRRRKEAQCLADVKNRAAEYGMGLRVRFVPLWLRGCRSFSSPETTDALNWRCGSRYWLTEPARRRLSRRTTRPS
jgi:hypothetical protein